MSLSCTGTFGHTGWDACMHACMQGPQTSPTSSAPPFMRDGLPALRGVLAGSGVRQAKLKAGLLPEPPKLDMLNPGV